MRLRTLLRSLWWNIVHRDRVNRALDDEVRSYVDLLAAEYERNGMVPMVARRAALVDTGGVERVKDAARDAWIGATLATTTRELRYALRSLRRSPAFVAIAVVTLAIGIGGATAVFSVINASLLRPLPAVAEPDRLVSVERVAPDKTLDEFTYPDYLDARAQATTLTGLAAYDGTSMTLEDRAGSTRAWVSYVSDNFFSVLGVHAHLGRFISPSDMTSGGTHPVVVLGDDVWRTRFGSDPAAIGATLKLNGVVLTIIGVAPPGFIGAMKLHHMDLWMPLTLVPQIAQIGEDDFLESRRGGWFRLVARLGPGRKVADAQRDLDVISMRLAAEYSENKGRGVRAFTGAGMLEDERIDASRMPRLLAMAVALLLLIACANVASLSLVRASAKRRELATRLALGASRASLVRHLSIEGAVLAACATALGILIAQALVRSASIVGTIGAVSPKDIHADARVLGVSIATTVLTAMLVSVFPGLQVSRTQVGLVMKDGTGGAVRRSRGQRTLVVVQVAASLVLLASAAMIFSAFQRALTANLGFEPRGLTYGFVDVKSAGYDSTRTTAFYQEFLDRAHAEPSVAGAALTSILAPAPWATTTQIFRRGEEPPPGERSAQDVVTPFRAYPEHVSPALFDVMRIPIVFGRAFTASDDERSTPVVIVSRRLANAMWPNTNPIGQFISWPSRTNVRRLPMQVVGVVGDTRHVSVTSPMSPVMYVPLAQHPTNNVVLVVRARGEPTQAVAGFRRIVGAIDPRVVPRGDGIILDRIDQQVRPHRTASAWIGVFGVVALLLAAIGLYGVVAQGVLQRTRELAVRSALGATPHSLLALVLREGMRLAASGAVVGAFAALLALRVLKNLFEGMASTDATAGVAAAVVLGAAMLAASYLPARRAARLNPVDALRCD
jgi:predicted permease